MRVRIVAFASVAALLLVVAPSAAFQNEVPLKERAAVRTGADFLELYAITPRGEDGRVSCGRRLSSSKRRCTFDWAKGRGTGVATITAFVSKNDRRLAAIRYRLVEVIPDCMLRAGGSCTATAKGEVVFRLRSGAKTTPG